MVTFDSCPTHGQGGASPTAAEKEDQAPPPPVKTEEEAPPPPVKTKEAILPPPIPSPTLRDARCLALVPFPITSLRTAISSTVAAPANNTFSPL
jgi:hypothetical protein